MELMVHKVSKEFKVFRDHLVLRAFKVFKVSLSKVFKVVREYKVHLA